ncbi:MAG TPA: FMN-binding negative transcriptional regulator [Ferrovibrio sp.]|uniref:FMN-binding negative transcriptional regulator n=1 Tax=Ferrovibrio sp. TaxID=1917215 RepID=UPI002B4B791C|nr:FMN-binding negative transcriptional regulator [Ferrovibrio sp.]HLT77779.1 FMN-binding negative transcriptional regulator [Ferrovibrio sp.]
MYIPAHFAVRDDLAPLYDLIESHAFGLLLCTRDDGGIEASHVPFLLDRPGSVAAAGAQGRLLCHLAAANGQAALLDGRPVTCIFQGPHGYVSPRWYQKKPAVPTWNYAVVHVHGRANVTREAGALRDMVDRLSKVYEPAEGGWQLGDEPATFVDAMLRGIVGVEIAIERLEGKFKLSQNRPGDIPGVLAALRDLGGDANAALADAMDRAAPRK